jgi:hypothetical protein
MAVATSTPYLSLGPRGYAWLEWGPECGRDGFEQIRCRLRDEFGAVTFDSLGFGSKEYHWLRMEEAELLLMWKDTLGPGLGTELAGLPHLLRVAKAFRAVDRGWRMRLYRWAAAWRDGRETPAPAPPGAAPS